MILNKTNLIVFLVGVFLGLCTGFFTGKAIYDQPIEESITRDTVIVYDTIPHYYPKPVDSAIVRYVTKVLPVVKYDTIFRENSVSFRENSVTDEHFADTSNMIAVEVPITSKHYSCKDYDAWVSGYEPSLDSIKVYQKEVLVTERVIVSKPPNKLALFLNAGVDYTFNDKKWYPHAGGELVLNNHKRIQFAVEGGVMKTPLVNGVNPYAGGKVKIRVF